jgi:NAD(P) transhydrogenase subunit alpha
LSEAGKVIEVNGVTIIGYLNMPSKVAAAASAFYAKNIFNYLQPNFKNLDGKVYLDMSAEDEIVSATVLTRDGSIVHPDFASS